MIFRAVFEEDGKYYPQIFLDECLYELQKCCSMKELMSLKELILISQINQKSLSDSNVIRTHNHLFVNEH